MPRRWTNDAPMGETMNEFQGADATLSTCTNCGRLIRKARYGDALMWEHIQRSAIFCTDDRGDLLGTGAHATPLEYWSDKDLELLAAMRIKP